MSTASATPDSFPSSRKNSVTGAEATVRMLEALGVTHIFGLCGDTTLPLYDAFARLDQNITHILTRDERHAAYMADAYARLTGKVGVCEGPSGGGATYILPGVVEANDSSIPILAITTDVATTSRGKFPLTELDQKALFAPVSKTNDMLDDASRLPRQLRNTFLRMTSGRPGSAHLGLPFDTQKAEVDPDEIWADAATGHYPATRAAPSPVQLQALFDALKSAKRGLIICGGGPVISGASDALARVAAALDMPVATSVSGQGALAETHPLCLGVVGSNGGRPQTRQVVEDADLILMIGCRAGSVTTERWRFPSAQQRILHIDSDPEVIGTNYATEVGIVADARVCLEMLAELLEKSSGNHAVNGGRTRVEQAVREKFTEFEQLATSDERPIRPERVIKALQEILDDDAVICADPGTPCPYFSAYYRWPKAGRHFITNRAHGALGFALGASIGAQFARPEAQVIAAMGDGSFGFSCGEIETIMRYQLPITAVVFSNASFGWIKAGQNSGFGQRFYNVDFSRTDHAAVARGFGMDGYTVDDPAQLREVLETAIRSRRPALVDIIAQPLHEAAAPVSEWVA